jgi:hypothetical protein
LTLQLDPLRSQSGNRAPKSAKILGSKASAVLHDDLRPHAPTNRTWCSWVSDGFSIVAKRTLVDQNAWPVRSVRSVSSIQKSAPPSAISACADSVPWPRARGAPPVFGNSRSWGAEWDEWVEIDRLR